MTITSTKVIISIIGLLFIFGDIRSVSAQTTTECSRRHVNIQTQCTYDCSTLGSNFQPDAGTGLCPDSTPPLICCYQTASSSSVDTSNLTLQIPLFSKATVSNLPEYLATVYMYLMIILVPLTIIMMIIGGVMWILAAGDQGKIKNAQSYIVSALAGLIIALVSYIILSLVGITQLKMPSVPGLTPSSAPTLKSP